MKIKLKHMEDWSFTAYDKERCDTIHVPIEFDSPVPEDTFFSIIKKFNSYDINVTSTVKKFVDKNNIKIRISNDNDYVFAEMEMDQETYTRWLLTN